PASLGEVYGRVHVRSPVLGGAEVVRRVPPPARGPPMRDRRERERSRGRPVDRMLVERMGQVDESGAIEIDRGGRDRERKAQREKKGHRRPPPWLPLCRDAGYYV